MDRPFPTPLLPTQILSRLLLLLLLPTAYSPVYGQTGKASLRAEYDCFVRKGTAVNLGRHPNQKDTWVFATAAHIVQAEEESDGSPVYPQQILVLIRNEWVSADYFLHSRKSDLAILLLESDREDLRYAYPADDYKGDAVVGSSIKDALTGTIRRPGRIDIPAYPEVPDGYSGSGVFAPGTDGLAGIVTQARLSSEETFLYIPSETIRSILNKEGAAPAGWQYTPTPTNPDQSPPPTISATPTPSVPAIPPPTPPDSLPLTSPSTTPQEKQELTELHRQITSLTKTVTVLSTNVTTLQQAVTHLHENPHKADLGPIQQELQDLRNQVRVLASRPTPTPNPPPSSEVKASTDCCDALLDIPLTLVWKARDGREMGRKQFTLREPLLELPAQRVIVQRPTGAYDADEYGPDEAIVISLSLPKTEEVPSTPSSSSAPRSPSPPPPVTPSP